MTPAAGATPSRADHVGSDLRPQHLVFAPEQCAFSHACGFSATAHGNGLSGDGQGKKRARCADVAEEVWGG